MLALRKTHADHGAELVEVAPPAAPPPGHATVEVAAVGICGSDLHAIAWEPGYAFMTQHLPLTLGHEFAGRVVALGDGVDDFAVGERVVCWPTIGCGDCRACGQGRPQDCQARRVIGLHRDGGFARLVLAPAANLRRLPENLPLDVAALAEPLAVAVNAVNLADLAPGASVVVLGPGPIGLLTAWVAAQRGARVALVGLEDSSRLGCAHELGLEHCLDLSQEALDQAVERIFAAPVDRVIEATGAAASIVDGLRILRSSGILVVAGIHAEPVTLDLTHLVRMKQQIRAAHDTTAEAFDEAVALLSAQASRLKTVISHRFPLTQALEGVEIARRREAVKVVLTPEEAAVGPGAAL